MIKPHGCNDLVNIPIGTQEFKGKDLLEIQFPDRYISDCEMLATGAYSPLDGFLSKENALSVINEMKLTNGSLWSIPILLPLEKNFHNEISLGNQILMKDKDGRSIAVLKVEDKFSLDLDPYCQKVFQTTDDNHPGVSVVKNDGNLFVGGKIIQLLNRPTREDIPNQYFIDPSETRKMFEDRGWKTIVAFQTRNPIHRAHEYLIKSAQESVDGVLIHPLVGETKKDDIPANIRMKCYEALIEKYLNTDYCLLSVLPTTMRYAGPREAIHHMILRKNYGCTHMIIGRDHAGVGDYYGTYDAQKLVDEHKETLKIQPMKFEHSFYCRKCENMASQKTCPHPKEDHLFLSGTKVRDMLQKGEKPPKEFTRSEVADILVQWAGKK